MIYISNNAVISYKLTGKMYRIKGQTIVFRAVKSRQRSIGAEIKHCAFIDHPQLGLL